jgi:hypothetical protein
MEAVLDHPDAESADRFLLRQMAPAEAATFEDHFFDCAGCAEDLRITAAFIANLRAAVRP